LELDGVRREVCFLESTVLEGEANMKSVAKQKAMAAAGSALAIETDQNLPMNVRDAARFLGVSPQTVYLWVERKQIPHLRVMGRNIRFLWADLLPFREQFKQEVENGKTAQA
jgi:excisionase family DNA binding protein